MLGHRLNICGIESTRLEAVKYSSLHKAPATHLCPQTACSFMREVSHKHEIIRQFFTWLRMLYPSTAFWGKKQTNMTSADWDIQKGSLKGRMARILMLRKGKKKKKGHAYLRDSTNVNFSNTFDQFLHSSHDDLHLFCHFQEVLLFLFFCH